MAHSNVGELNVNNAECMHQDAGASLANASECRVRILRLSLIALEHCVRRSTVCWLSAPPSCCRPFLIEEFSSESFRRKTAAFYLTC